MVIGSDVSSNAVRRAKGREHLWKDKANGRGQVEFAQMNATEIGFLDSTFGRTSIFLHFTPLKMWKLGYHPPLSGANPVRQHVLPNLVAIKRLSLFST